LAYKPFYVGKGNGARSHSHVKLAETTSLNSHKLNKIRKILAAGYEVVVGKTKLMTEAKAFAKEVELISTIGRTSYGGPLTNLTDGGDGAAGFVFTEKDRKACSTSQKIRFMLATQDEFEESNKKRKSTIEENPEIEEQRKRAWYEKLTPEAREVVASKTRKQWRKMSEKDIARRESRRLATNAAKTQEEKSLMADQKRQTRKSKGKEWEDKVQARRLKAFNARSKEEIAETNRKRGEATRRRHEENRRLVISDKDLIKLCRLHATGKYTQAELGEKFGVTSDRVRRLVTNQ